MVKNLRFSIIMIFCLLCNSAYSAKNKAKVDKSKHKIDFTAFTFDAMNFRVIENQPNIQSIKTGLDLQESKRRCSETYIESNQLYVNDLQFQMTFAQMKKSFRDIYNSGKRLPRHSTYENESNQFYLHLYRDNYFKVPISVHFISNVISNIEKAIRLEYADFVFMSDLGHTHLLFPQPHWNAQYRDAPISDGELYRQMLNDSKLRPLYHASEQLRQPDETSDTETAVQHGVRRHNCRNILGSNDGSNLLQLHSNSLHPRNTVHEIEGYKRYSAGFLISASKDGCFGFYDRNGKKLYLDIGLTEFSQDPKYGSPCDI